MTLPSWKVTRFLVVFREDAENSLYCQPCFNCPCCNLCSRSKVQFPENIAYMYFSRSFADHQKLGNFPARFPLRNESCDFTLTRCQSTIGLFGSLTWTKRFFRGYSAKCRTFELGTQRCIIDRHRKFCNELPRHSPFLFRLIFTLKKLICLSQRTMYCPEYRLSVPLLCTSLPF